MRLSPIQAVVFDIGGVLEDTPRTGWEQSWCDRLAISPGQLHDSLRHLWVAGTIGTITLDEVREGIGDVLGFTASEVDAFVDDRWREYLGTPNTDVINYFASLGDTYRTGILSNSFVGARERERERYDFESMCQAVVYSHEEGVKKPDAESYLIVCRKLGVDPEGVVFVDDTDACLAGARAAGMTPVAFIDQRQTISSIEAVLAGTSMGWTEHA